MNYLTKIDGMPMCFNIPIIDYSDSKVYCIGYFREPNDDEIRTHSRRPYAIFEPAEPHGWKMSFYSSGEVASMVSKAIEI